MNRREFIALSGVGVANLAFSSCNWQNSDQAQSVVEGKNYSIVILGDTHFDTEPASVYHSHYNEPVEWLNKVQRAEFARNGEMWRERCPRLMRRAAELIDKNTKMVFQMGDLVQGDCGKGEVHQKMLEDVMNSFKGQLGGLPFISVVGNHDIRGVDAKQVYHDFMPKRISQELGMEVKKTTFSFTIGDDAYLFVDFNDLDVPEIEKILNDTKGARHTFLSTHGPIFPIDGGSPHWYLFGGYDEESVERRLYFRRKFAERDTICLCGHSHHTSFVDWFGDGGRITQVCMNSVWSNDEKAKFEPFATEVSQFGEKYRQREDSKPENMKQFDDYRDGLRTYIASGAAGSYKLNVSKHDVTVDFYGGDSQEITRTFVVRS